MHENGMAIANTGKQPSHPAAQIQDFTTVHFRGLFQTSSGVLRSLIATAHDFDFSVNDVFDKRNGNGNHHTGDFTLRWRHEDEQRWQEASTITAHSRVFGTTRESTDLLCSDFTGHWPELKGVLSIERRWKTVEDDLALVVSICNTSDKPVEIGAFGFPLEFNSIFTGRSQTDTTQKCVLIDPYIGLDAGYVQVTRLTGLGPSLLVTPYGGNSRLEGWRYLEENRGGDLSYQSHTFEGFYSWETVTKAYAETEWKNTKPWNEATSTMLAPGQRIEYGLRFSLVDSIEGIEDAVATKDLPVAVGLPGYILPADVTGNLYLRHDSASIDSITTEPPNALSFQANGHCNAPWKGYTIEATATRGRVCIKIRYSDGKLQTVHYMITDPAPLALSKLARFLFSEQWLDCEDVFGRSPGIVTYDIATRQKVLQDRRVWIAGLQDEGGAASWVAAAMKTAFHPRADEVAKLEHFALQTVWGGLQYAEPCNGYPKYSIKRSLFHYEPSTHPAYKYDASLDWTGWASWTKEEAEKVWRPYNYVWVSGLYWSLYRAEKAKPGILTQRDALWYLNQAMKTLETCYALYDNGEPLVDFRSVGLMGEIIWYELLSDLDTEGISKTSVVDILRERQREWSESANPFGSEAPWDSTGQEAVYLWSKYFKDQTTVDKTLESIRGYMPSIAHWAYNGNARRYWDFDVAGKLAQIERQVHHYGSPLNAIPLLHNYLTHPEPSSKLAIHDLRIGYGGWLGALSNINEEGFASQAFHARADIMRWDDYSSDYGAGLPGHMIMSMTVVFEHPDFGFVAMPGDLEYGSDGKLLICPKDTVRRQVYLAPLGLHVKVSAGSITQLSYNPSAETAEVHIDGDEAGDSINITWRSTRGRTLQETASTSEATSSTDIKTMTIASPSISRFQVVSP